jgi:hypothetical protein
VQSFLSSGDFPFLMYEVSEATEGEGLALHFIAHHLKEASPCTMLAWPFRCSGGIEMIISMRGRFRQPS